MYGWYFQEVSNWFSSGRNTFGMSKMADSGFFNFELQIKLII